MGTNGTGQVRYRAVAGNCVQYFTFTSDSEAKEKCVPCDVIRRHQYSELQKLDALTGDWVRIATGGIEGHLATLLGVAPPVDVLPSANPTQVLS